MTIIQNQTASKLTLTGVDNEKLSLAPRQIKTIDDDDTFYFKELEREGLVRSVKDSSREIGEDIFTLLFGVGFWGGLGTWWLSSSEPMFDLSEKVWKIGVWSLFVLILTILIFIVVINVTNSGTLVKRFTSQLAALIVILAIGVGLPVCSIYYFGYGRELLDIPDANPLALFTRFVQLAFISIASLLPVLLFFLFDRYQLGTLRNRLYLDIFRLEPSLRTIGEIDAKYGSQISEAYGPETQGRGRLAPGSRWPVLVCSIVITIGWIVTLAPIGFDLKPETVTDALIVLQPQQTTLVYGFLGAYFFSLRLIALRYARGDLKPKAYSHIMVRIFIVAVLCWVLDVIFSDESTVRLVLAFLFGITPDEFFTWLKGAMKSKYLKSFSKELPENIIPEASKLPLTDLDGIDLYDRSRLESEGIVNIEGFAHYDLIKLIIESRLPVPRLIDWMDQAILYLHLVGGSDAKARIKLRDYGIRSATDLLLSWDESSKRSNKEFKKFKQILGDVDPPPYRLEVIRDAMHDDEWLVTILNWRKDIKHQEKQHSALPTTAEGLERFAETQMQNGRNGAALNFLNEAVFIRNKASSRLLIAQILSSSSPEYSNWAKASEHADIAFKLEPEDPVVLKQLCKIYINIEEYDSALIMCQNAIAIVSSWKKGKHKDSELKALEILQQQIEER